MKFGLNRLNYWTTSKLLIPVPLVEALSSEMHSTVEVPLNVRNVSLKSDAAHVNGAHDEVEERCVFIAIFSQGVHVQVDQFTLATARECHSRVFQGWCATAARVQQVAYRDSFFDVRCPHRKADAAARLPAICRRRQNDARHALRRVLREGLTTLPAIFWRSVIEYRWSFCQRP